MVGQQPTSTVESESSGGVTTIWLNRPDRRNAVTAGLVEDLLGALDAVATGRQPAGVVLLAGKGKAFCAGHDLKEPVPPGDSRPRLERLQEVTRRIRALRQPVIAVVQGWAVGAGAEFALGCDLVLAAEDAAFRFPEVGLGLSVTGGASRLLPAIVGPLKAKELVLLGEPVDAAAAQRLGLVNTVLPADELHAGARQRAQQLAANPTAAALAKRALDAGPESSLDAALELEVTHALLTETSGEASLPTDPAVQGRS
ncbi:enoyl-CoA hydratase/isomerase family protein [Haloechinothrix sp. LS1_15]|uniref:enoyl-CoA hydratase/isomerase family protein n=1 Tax=Haloechinothrix sp. LS1_15 TaxID=2652248 RepID=UPI00294602AA|nr:enoyl-CoA hydratase/isomerase family protein [Haloechinothrix sp. LS1_15]MDV6014327.1 enoyl-CoA hydratase/isomerase family protein [Haloechinothrix sp. LS1_15]